MQVTVDTSKLIAQLKALREQIERKLEVMVERWTYDVVKYIINETPIGDYEKYGWLYDAREEWSDGLLAPIPGLSKGSWQVSFDGDLQFIQRYSAELAISDNQSEIGNYRVGQTYYIGSTTPYVEVLNTGSSRQLPNGFKPVVDTAINMYKLNLKQYYDSAGV